MRSEVEEMTERDYVTNVITTSRGFVSGDATNHDDSLLLCSPVNARRFRILREIPPPASALASTGRGSHECAPFLSTHVRFHDEDDASVVTGKLNTPPCLRFVIPLSPEALSLASHAP